MSASTSPQHEGPPVGRREAETCRGEARMSWQDDQCHRFNNFDAMRFWLAALVILSHSYPLLGHPDPQEPLMRATGGQLTFGTLAVQLFFVLSGFLITQSWVKGSGLADFLRKRVVRIYPGLVVVVLLGALVIAPAFSPEGWALLRRVDVVRLIWGCISLDGYSPPGSFAENPFANVVNGSLWTIPYEFRCYLMVAALGMLGWLGRRWSAAALFAVALGAYTVLVVTGFEWAPKNVERLFGHPTHMLRLMAAFLAGSIFFLYRGQIPRSGGLAIASAAVLLVSAFIPPALTVALPIAGTYLFFYLAFERRLGVSGWGRYGDFSYGVYLYAFPIQQCLVTLLPEGTSPLVLFPLALGVTTVAAALSWYLVESPSMKWGRRFSGPRRAGVPSAPSGPEGSIVAALVQPKETAL